MLCVFIFLSPEPSNFVNSFNIYQLNKYILCKHQQIQWRVQGAIRVLEKGLHKCLAAWSQPRASAVSGLVLALSSS